MFSFFSRGQPAPSLQVQDSLPTPSNSPPRGSSVGPPPTPSPQPEGTSSAGMDITALRTLISSVPAKIVHQYVLARLKEEEDEAEREFSPDCLAQVAFFFKDLTPPRLLHCVRCHGNYFAVENNDRACRVQHDDKSAEVSRTKGGLISKGHTYETLWGCCGKTVEGDGDMGPPDGWCYEGTHTTDPRRARFRADSAPFPGDDKLISCEKKRCKDASVPSRRRPARKRARMLSYQDASDHELVADEKDDPDEDSDEEARSVKSASTRGGGGRKRRKLSAPPETQDDGMDVDGSSIASAPVANRPKSRAKPRSVSSNKPRSRATPITPPPVPPLPTPISFPESASATTTPTKNKSSSKPKSKALEMSFTVAASGEEAEAEDTEPSPSVKKKVKKSTANGEGDDQAKKRRKKKKNPDSDGAPYVDDAEGDASSEEVLPKKKNRKSVTKEDAMVVDNNDGEPTSARKKPKKTKALPTSDAEDAANQTTPLKPKKTKKKLADVVQSSIASERALT